MRRSQPMAALGCHCPPGMKSKGTLQQVPAAERDLTAKYRQRVDDNPAHKAFANDAGK